MRDIDIVAKKYVESGKDKESIYSRIDNDLTASYDWFDEKFDIRNTCMDFLAGRQWTKEEEMAFRKQFRYPYTFNEIQHKVNHLVGIQIQTRLDAKMVARESGDEAKAELLTYLNKWVEQVNQLEAVETEVFLDAITGGVGWTVCRWENEDLEYGYPKIESIPADEMLWDLTARKHDLSDARWIARESLISRMEALEMFPDQEDYITNQAAYGTGRYSHLIYHDRYRQYIADESRDLLRMIEYYERVKTNIHIVIDSISNEVYKFDNKKDAEDFYDGVCSIYIKAGQNPLNPDGSERIVLTSKKVDVIFQTIIVGDEVFVCEPTELQEFPFVPIFCYFYNGDYWGFVEGLISPQILVNRFFSQWDYMVGTSSKNLTTINDKLLQKGFTISKASEELSKIAPIVPVISHDAIKQHPNQQANPDLFNAVGFGIERMVDYAGGANALGLQENAAESGRAVIARAEQGGVSKLPIFDRLRIWRQAVVSRNIWWIKNFMPVGQIFRIIGTGEQVKYVTLDDNHIDSLRSMRVDIIIDEVARSENAKERMFEQLVNLFGQVGGVPMEIALSTLLKYSSLPESEKDELREMMQFYQEYIQQKSQAEHEQKLTQQVQDSLRKKQMKDVMEGTNELEEKTKKLKSAEEKVKVQMDKLKEAQEKAQQEGLTPEERKSLIDGMAVSDMGSAQARGIMDGLV